MRLSKVITIDDDRITVFEVSVEDLLSVIQSSEEDLRNRADELLPKCTDISLERLKKLYPSELKKVWDAFAEVNAVFFSAIDRLGIHRTLLDGIKKVMAEEMARNLTGPTSSSGSAG